MKIRYFILPILIISVIVLILESNDNITNKELKLVNGQIIYPFFGNDNIDIYINDYLNKYIDNDNCLVDYDLIKNNNLYYLTFYSYLYNDNIISNNIHSFVIDLKNNTINKIQNISYVYDFYNYDIKDNGGKYVALTFEDGPNYNTNKILDILDKYGVPATFFILNENINGNENVIRRMNSLGMEIGSHIYNHLILTKKEEVKIKREIENTNETIFDITGKYPSLLRYEYGYLNKRISEISNMSIITWNIDSLDSKYHNSEKIVARVINKVSDGDIILMHDTYSSSANALDNIIPMLKEMGYTFVTVSDLFYNKGITLEKGRVYGNAE